MIYDSEGRLCTVPNPQSEPPAKIQITISCPDGSQPRIFVVDSFAVRLHQGLVEQRGGGTVLDVRPDGSQVVEILGLQGIADLRAWPGNCDPGLRNRLISHWQER